MCVYVLNKNVSICWVIGGWNNFLNNDESLILPLNIFTTSFLNVVNVDKQGSNRKNTAFLLKNVATYSFTLPK